MPRWQRTPSATRVHRSSAASTGVYSERRRFVTSPSDGRNGGTSSLTLVRSLPSNRPLHHRSVSRRRTPLIKRCWPLTNEAHDFLSNAADLLPYVFLYRVRIALVRLGRIAPVL